MDSTRFVFILSTVAYFVSFFVSIKMVLRSRNHSNIIDLVWYCTLAFLLSSIKQLQILNVLKFSDIDPFLTISVLFHYCFLGFYILRELKGRAIKHVASVSFFIFYLASIWGTQSQLQDHNMLGFIITSVGLFILSVVYFLDLFGRIKEKPFWFFPDFWVVSGIFVLNSINIPPYLFSTFLYYNSPKLYNTVFLIHSFAYILMHLFFIKGMLCQIQRRS